MPIVLPVYILSGLVGIAAIFSGLTNTKLPFMEDTRSAVLILSIAGFIMCSTGAITLFVSKAPASPLTISGYLLGAAALFIGIAQIFRINFPFVCDARFALLAMTGIIILKVVIARLNFLLT